MEVVVADSFLPASSRCSTTVGRGPGSSLATSPPPPARPRVLHLDLASREIQGQVGPGQASGASQVLHTNPSLHSSSSQARTLSRTASKRGSSPAPAPARPSLVRPRARGSTRSRCYNLGPQLNNNSKQFRLHSRLISNNSSSNSCSNSCNNSSNNSSNNNSNNSSSNRRPQHRQFSNNNKCNTNLQQQCSRCNHKLQLQMQSSFNKHKYTSNSSNFNNNNFSNNSYSYNNNNNNNNNNN